MKDGNQKNVYVIKDVEGKNIVAFALPVYGENGEVERYNIFHTSLIVRHSEDDKLYLYDILDIKKETSNPIEP